MKGSICPIARQLTLALDTQLISDLAVQERAQVVSLLAVLLLEAIGMAEEEEDDEER